MKTRWCQTYKWRRREILQRYKKLKGCEYCGYNKFHGALHFDHIDPATKISSSKKAVQYKWSWKKLKQEVSKCRILCANCHAERHWND